MKIDKEINEPKEKVFVKLFEVDYSIPDWQKSIVLERLESYKKDPETTSDFEETITKLEVSLMY